MPFGKSFNVVLESASESENDAFLLLDSTADGVDVEEVSRVQYGNIHKVKGMTFDNVIVDLTRTRTEDYFTQLRLKYVAYSRGKFDCWTVASQGKYTLGVR